MSITFTIDTPTTLEMRKKLATENIVLYTALGEEGLKALWVAYYKQLIALTESADVMDIPLPGEPE